MANEYKVKVGVEFNAIMNNVDSKLAQLKEDIKAVGNAGGNKQFLAGFQEDVDKLVAKLNKLRETEITPGNFNRFQAEISSITDDIAKAKGKMDEFASNSFGEKMAAQQNEINKLNTAIADYTKTVTDLQTRQQNGEQLNDDEIKQLQEADAARIKAQRSLNGHLGALAKLEKQQGIYNNVTKGSEQIVEGAAKAVDELDKESKEYLTTQEQLANEKLANTIQTQVNRFIGFNAVLRYSRKYIQDLVKTYKEFDESLVAIAAVTGQTRDQMWQNIGVYNKMAQSLGTTTQEVINASKLYYQQGLTTTSVLKLTEETVKLATIAELDSADATEYLTTAMNGFKLSAEESTRVTDVWANLAAKTASDVDELAVAISKVASLAENAGMEIETASAFLNQMIETTREAPENLGTALKTIIARFQELKVSEEALSDGVDANKVERALKSAGVALRDVDGQFRDFDDVILDLSAKWNTLDRNTQRYIATIAAGSRQQSRFIALVSDYEGLVRNVNYAYDSLGSADAQMAVFQEGLTASTNRLKAAWEGLYTSWSESATVISKLIDGAADFVSTLADLGAGISAVLALGGLLVVRILAGAAAREIEKRTTQQSTKITNTNTLALLENAKALLVNSGADATKIEAIEVLIAKTKEYIAVEEISTKQSIKTAIANIGVAAKYLVIAAAIALVMYAIVKLINHEKDYIKNLEKQQQAQTQAAAQAKDRASSIDVLIKELDQAKNSETELFNVRQKIIDQFGDQIEGIDDETLSYKDLIAKLEEYKRLQEGISAANYIAASKTNNTLDLYESGVKEVSKQQQKKGTNTTGNYDQRQNYEWVTVWTYNGEEYSSQEELIKNHPELVGKDNLTEGQKNFVAKAIIDSGEIKKETELSKDIIKTFYDSLKPDEQTSLFDAETGKIDTGLAKRFNEINNQINDFYEKAGETEKNQIESLLNGSFDNLTDGILTNLIAQFGKFNPEFAAVLENLKNSYQDNINKAFSSSGLSVEAEAAIKNNLSLGAQKAFVDTFNALAENPEAQTAYKNAILKLIATSTNPEEINSAIIESFGNPEEAFSAYSAMLGSLGEMKEGVDPAIFNALRDALEGMDNAFAEGKATVDAYYSSMKDLADLQKGDLSNEDYLAKLYSEAAALAEVTDKTYEQIVAEMLQATTLNEEGNMVLQMDESLKKLANSQYEASAQTVEGKKAELLAYAAGQDAIADYIYALADEVEAGNLTTEQAVANLQGQANAQVDTGNVAEETRVKGEKMWKTLEGNENTAVHSAIQDSYKDIQKQLDHITSKDELLQLGSEAKARALDARAKAAQLSISKLASTFDKAGKSAGGAAKETDKYKEALKELEDQLKDAKDEAEKYIDAILDYLGQQKEAAQAAIDTAEEALEKERSLLKIQLEAWKEYITKRQEAAQADLDLQGQAAAEYFKVEIEGIQAKIDALDKEAEAEDRILKLQKARDEYNRAQNSRTRLVLTKGAGWIFKSDQKQITDARKALNDVQREIQKAAYQDQIDELQKQADMWQEIAEDITKSAEEIAKLAAAVDKFRQGIEAGGIGYADVDAYDTAVTAQQGANDEYQRQLEEVEKWLEQADWSYQDYMDDQARQQFFKEFMDGTVGEQDLQEKVTAYLQDILTTEAYIEEQKKIIEKIEKVEAEYELEKTQLGLTKAQLKEAKKIRKAIEKAFDPESGDLGLGKGSSYYQEVVSPLVETVQKIAEELAKLEAGQGDGSGSGSGGGSGSGSGNGDSSSPGTPSQESTSTTDWDGSKDKEDTPTTPPSATSCPPHNWILAYAGNHIKHWVCTKCGEVKTESGTDLGTPGFGGVGGIGKGGGKPPVLPPIGGQNGIGLPSMSILSTSTPSFNKVTNSSSAMTINIGTLQSSANNFDGLVADITRNSMLRQPI